jgi:hypothetical protein
MSLPILYSAQVGSPYTTLAAPYTTGEDTMTVVDATKLPDAPNIVCLSGSDAGEFSYTGKVGNILQGVTALPGTPSATWDVGTYAFRGIAAYDLNAIHKNMVRTATYVVAASNAPDHVKRQADYICDGIDDQVEIQAAIDALPATGGTVHLSAGNYLISETIRIETRDNTTLSGSGANVYEAAAGTIITLADGSNCTMIYVNKRNCHIQDLKLMGNRTHQTAGNGIEFGAVGGHHPWVHRVGIFYSYDTGLKVNGYGSGSYEDVWIEYYGRVGMHLNHHNGASLRHVICMSRDEGTTGFLITFCNRLRFLGCHTSYNTNGFVLELNSNNNTFTACLVRNTCYKEAIVLSNSAYNTFTACVLQDPCASADATYDAISIGVNSPGNIFQGLQTGRLIQNNRPRYIISDGAYGQSQNTVVTGCVFKDFSEGAISLYGEGSIVENNVGYKTRNAGTFTIPSGATSVKIDHGLAGTPSHVYLSLTSSLGAADEIYVSNKDADSDGTKFQIVVNADPGRDVTGDWFAVLTEYGTHTHSEIDNLVPIMTSNTTPSGVASASGEVPGREAWKAFNRTTNGPTDSWRVGSPGPAPTGWIQYQLVSPAIVVTYAITAYDDVGAPNTSPITWTLQGSNDGVTWDILDDVSKQRRWRRRETRSYNINNTTPYAYYRLDVTEIGNMESMLTIGNIALYGPVA